MYQLPSEVCLQKMNPVNKRKDAFNDP